MKNVLVFLMMAIMACSMLLTGCGGEEKKAADSAKVLRVGTEPVFAPFEFPKEGSKDLTGFDIELIEALGKQMGYKVEMVSMGFDALIPALNSNNIDVAIAGMTITDERKKVVDFTESYYTSGLMIMVRKDSNVKSIDDLKGKTIACQIGTTGENKSRTVEGAKVKAFNTQDEASLELKNGGADAVIGDAPVIEYYMTKAGKDFAKTVGERMEAEPYGIAVKKGSKLAGDLNKALAELKKSGEYDKLYTKWFGEKK